MVVAAERIRPRVVTPSTEQITQLGELSNAVDTFFSEGRRRKNFSRKGIEALFHIPTLRALHNSHTALPEHGKTFGQLAPNGRVHEWRGTVFTRKKGYIDQRSVDLRLRYDNPRKPKSRGLEIVFDRQGETEVFTLRAVDSRLHLRGRVLSQKHSSIRVEMDTTNPKNVVVTSEPFKPFGIKMTSYERVPERNRRTKVTKR